MSEDVYNPRDRIKNHLKRKSSSRKIDPSQTSFVIPTTVFPEISTESCPLPSTSSNPFKVASPQKKRRKPENNEDEDSQVFFQQTLVERQENTPTTTPTKDENNKKGRKAKSPKIGRYPSCDPNLMKEMHVIDFSQLLAATSNEGVKPPEPIKEQSEKTPLDLRIGRKLRIVSKTPFSWMSSRKTTGIVAVRIPATERYSGLKFFNEVFRTGSENPTVPLPSPLSILEASTLYWQFPVVPGLPLYPRINSEQKVGNRVPLAPLTTSTITDQWVECFEQLFMSYKKGERESFYVASAVFNVLFTKTDTTDDVDVGEESQSCFGLVGGQKLVALVSHTTSSTREHLRNQGVEYEVLGDKTIRRSISSSTLIPPFSRTLDGFEMAESRTSCEPSSLSNGNTPADESSDENESPTKANQEWLQGIGVSPGRFKGTSTRKLSFQTNREEVSCLLVKGSSVQSLYNMLMSSDVVHEKSGPYNKVPPTLIASSAFLYGQLLSLNKSSQILNKAGSKAAEYVLELEGGPILPHCANMIITYLRNSNLCGADVHIQVSDRHSSNGMNDWTERATNWNKLQVLNNCVHWNKVAV